MKYKTSLANVFSEVAQTNRDKVAIAFSERSSEVILLFEPTVTPDHRFMGFDSSQKLAVSTALAIWRRIPISKAITTRN